MAQPIHFLLLLAIGGLLFSIVSGELDAIPPTETNPEQVLFRKQLDKDREIVVIREQSRPLTILNGLTAISDENLKRLHAVFPVRVEVRSANTASLTLCTHLVYDLTPGRGFEVLDMLVGHGQIVIAAIEHSVVRLWLWRISPISLDTSQVTTLDQYDWTRFAAAVTLDKSMVSAKLTWTEDHLVEVAVDDLRPNFKQHTRFIQKPNEWSFQKATNGKGQREQSTQR
jgi:hypothetical protein